MRALALLLTLFIGLHTSAVSQESIDDFTDGMQHQDGFFPLYWDADAGTLYLRIDRLDEPFLYLSSLATGMGSNRLGLDRGLIGQESVARFLRAGPRIHLSLDNPTFVATTDNPDLERSVRESFPTSVIAALDIVAQEGGDLLVDVTPFLLRDQMGVAARLSGSGQGSYSLQRDRSAVYMPRSKAFPINTELEASLTFAGSSPGPEVFRHTPDARAITVRQHHSFVQLPDDEFRPRPFDPRIGIFPVTHFDYARAFDEGYESRVAIRHRLIKQNPNAAMSDPVEPIVYYMDRGIPEPYRTAFKDGLVWFEDLFEAAGFTNAFRVEDMPADMDPLDARYDVIQWVHRTQAGSSIGPSFVDPRTGEIIKAAVRMDSHRSLVDFNLFGGALPAVNAEAEQELMAADAELGSWIATLDPDISAEEFAMARRRQHSAHEIGHTLGLAHNFIAASYGRASVMDYPAPLIELDGDQIRLANAYRPGAGAYDSIAIRYAYTEFAPEDEAAGLQAIVDEAIANDLAFITNPDENANSSYPAATTWINGGADVLAELRRVNDVRRVLIDRFDDNAITDGQPMYLLNRRFVAVYLHHRYTLTAAIKSIGGMSFRYAMYGEDPPPTQIVPAARQREALELLLDAIQPAELAVPEDVMTLMAPRPFGYGNDNRAFRTATGPAFDQIGVARTLASMVINGILSPQRAARVVAFHDRDPSLPTLEDIIGRMVERTWGQDSPDGHAALSRTAERVLLDRLMELVMDEGATTEVRAAAEWGVGQIGTIAAQAAGAGDTTEQAHVASVLGDIGRFENRETSADRGPGSLVAPPGTPIGNR